MGRQRQRRLGHPLRGRGLPRPRRHLRLRRARGKRREPGRAFQRRRRLGRAVVPAPLGLPPNQPDGRQRGLRPRGRCDASVGEQFRAEPDPALRQGHWGRHGKLRGDGASGDRLRRGRKRLGRTRRRSGHARHPVRVGRVRDQWPESSVRGDDGGALEPSVRRRCRRQHGAGIQPGHARAGRPALHGREPRTDQRARALLAHDPASGLGRGLTGPDDHRRRRQSSGVDLQPRRDLASYQVQRVPARPVHRPDGRSEHAPERKHPVPGGLHPRAHLQPVEPGG